MQSVTHYPSLADRAVVDLVADDQAQLGECPLWCERSASLWWTDIEGSRIRRISTLTGETRSWSTPDRVGSFALCEDANRLLLGMAGGVALFDLDRGALASPLVPVEPHIQATRINDGRCDAEGRFVFGMFNQESGDRLGSFYRVHPDLSVERLDLPQIAVANSIAFSPDGRRMYFTDSPQRRIWCASYPLSGPIGKPELFADLTQQTGAPDGSCVDADGGLWNASWDGSCLRRYDSSGRETHSIALPVSRPTCCAFGGPALEQLYVASARIGLKAERLTEQPHAGGIFVTTPGVRGLPERRFQFSGAR